MNSGEVSGYLQTWIEDVTGLNTPADITCDGVTNSSVISAFLAVWLASTMGQTPLDRCP